MLLPVLSLGLKGCVLYSSAKLLRKAWHTHKNRRPSALLTGNEQCTSERIVIVTTAAIPWRTGTAVNPVLRAAHLAALTQYKVTLVVPFVPIQDQQLIFPTGVTCSTPAEQAAAMRSWAQEHSQLPAAALQFDIIFYSARYYPASRCIFASEDISKLLPTNNVSLVLLEEPEHLNWYRSNNRWTSHYQHVVGVLHTHYSGYAADLPGGFLNAAAVGLVCRVVCRLHCHKVVQLSELARGLSRSTVVNTHGVSAKFIRMGQQQAHKLWKQQQQQQEDVGQHDQGIQPGPGGSCFAKGCYFLGKALWDKGHGDLMDLLQHHRKKYGLVAVDIYGVGPDLAAIQADAERRGLPLVFKGHADHCSTELQQYKVFINCCRKDVLATATAEAVAMNKWVILPDVACNQFFKTFPNVLLFSSKASFSQQLLRALEYDPPALSEDHLRDLSWAAATERLLQAASITSQEWPGALAQVWDDCLWVPYRLFALLFKGARQAFAAAPKLPQQELEMYSTMAEQERMLSGQQQQHSQLKKQQQKRRTVGQRCGKISDQGVGLSGPIDMVSS